MSFARAEYDENEIRWDAIRARLEDDEDESENYGIGGLSASSDDEDDDEDEERPARGSGRKGSSSRRAVASTAVAEARLPKLKAAAERVRRIKEAGIDPERTYEPGEAIYDPFVQRFGEVVWAAEGYVRIHFSDGTETAYGKPPMEDRKNFIVANFHRLDNKTMAEVLDISVHTMRRLCHEYGLKRQKGDGARASA